MRHLFPSSILAPLLVVLFVGACSSASRVKSPLQSALEGSQSHDSQSTESSVRDVSSSAPAGSSANSPHYQDEQPFAYKEPAVDGFYNSGYEESLYSPFSFN